MPPAPDEAIEGFDDLVEIARSERAVVFRAWQPTFRRHVAIKLTFDRDLERLKRDSGSASALAGHPNVVSVHTFGLTHSRVPFVAMEYLEGGSLADRVRRDGALAWTEAAHFTILLTGVVMTADEVGVGGLVVTPEAVLVSRFAEPKLSLVGSRCRGDVRATQPTADASGLRTTLLAMLTGKLDPERATFDGASGPESLCEALRGGENDLGAFAARLQAAQAEAGEPITELPLGAASPVALQPAGATVRSDAVTVGHLWWPHSARRLARRSRTVLVLVAVVAVGLAATLARDPKAAINDPASRPTSTREFTPINAPPWAADFAPGRGWDYVASAGSESAYVDGEYHLDVQAGAEKLLRPWRSGAEEHRLRVLIEGRVATNGAARMNLICGFQSPGFKFLAAGATMDSIKAVAADRGQPLPGSAGTAAEPISFQVRLECVTERAPTSATLFLNDSVIGTVAGAEAFPIREVGIHVVAAPDHPVHLELTRMEVHRLE